MFVSCECCVLSLEVSQSGRLLVQRSPIEYGLSNSYSEASLLRGSEPLGSIAQVGGKLNRNVEAIKLGDHILNLVITNLFQNKRSFKHC
jgi:hypothetical protein